MGRKPKFVPGTQYYELMVTDYPYRPDPTKRNYLVEVECQLCGTVKEIWTSELGNGAISCGCWKRDLNKDKPHDKKGQYFN